MDATGRVTINTKLFVFYLKAAPFLLNSTRNPSGTERQMLLSHGGLLKVAEHRWQWRGKESWKICFVQRTRTHTHIQTGLPSRARYRSRRAVEQVAQRNASCLHASWHCQPAAPSFSFLYILGYTVHPVPIEGEEGRRNRREPVQRYKLFKRTSLLRHGS